MTEAAQLTKEYVVSMTAGAALSNPMNDIRVPENWNGTEECGDLAYAIDKYMDENNITYLGIMATENAARKVLKSVLDGQKLEKRPDHDSYDEYARGFLAGQVFGFPTYTTFKLVKEAEDKWDADSNNAEPKYGYYQELLNEIKRREEK